MSKDSLNSLSEAIAKLESVGQSKTQQIKEHLEKDYEEIKNALETMKPYLDEVKQKVEKEAKDTKNQVERKVKESPWLALGIVGLVAFFIGIFIGRRDK
ncbi:MAG: DUF883 family protein [Bdellovibrionaceae bacterium]|nr:DUF883 family protein [Pseudobdellovibrionaceae bacterium]